MAVVSVTSFGLRVALLLDLDGFSVFVSAATVAMATMRVRQCGIKRG